MSVIFFFAAAGGNAESPEPPGDSKPLYLCLSGGFCPEAEAGISVNPYTALLDYPLFEPPRNRGGWVLELAGPSGAVLAAYRFGTEFMRVNRPDGERVRDSGMFALSVPVPESFEGFRILKGKEILFESKRSPHPPRVRITAPRNGARIADALEVAWEAQDADGQTLFCRLESSRDGGRSWSPETVFMTARRVVREKRFLGSGPSIRIRVVCTDGLNTAFDTVEVVLS